MLAAAFTGLTQIEKDARSAINAITRPGSADDPLDLSTPKWTRSSGGVIGRHVAQAGNIAKPVITLGGDGREGA